VLHLSTFWQTPARHLSLGQRVRCDLAAAIIHRPRVLFLDEPTIGLDVLVKAQVRTLMRTLADSGDHTIVLTTHDVADVEALCQRLIVIDHGKVVHDGPSATLAGTTRGLETALRKLYATSSVPSGSAADASP
jgi:ABC-2 type transport system ATP-binding protein